VSPCPVCRSNRGVERISPAPPVHEGRFWLVEHAYPCSLLGWLVIVLKGHAEALHDLTMSSPRHHELDPELISAGIFAHLNADADGVLEPAVVRSFCAGIGEAVRRLTHGGMP